MAKKTVYGSVIRGKITAPSSKSYAQRALAGALLAKGTSILRNPCRSDDVISAVSVIKNLGAGVEDFNDRLIVHGGLSPVRSTLDFGEAGLGIRLFSSIAALQAHPIYLTGSGSLTVRPMKIIEEALTSLGVSCHTENGYLPVRIQGPIKGGEIKIDGSMSSQVLTGLLMALPLVDNDSTIWVDDLKSTPYIDMTIELMKLFGVELSHENYQKFTIPGKQEYKALDYFIEGDWSGAAFLLVAGAIAGEVEVLGLNPESLQADKKILEALNSSGAEVILSDNSIIVRSGQLRSFNFDATHCPDLFPPLVALAAHCSGETRIKGVNRLIHKESNRAAALETEMSKLGVHIRTDNDTMLIDGGKVLQGAKVESHNDHRIAMAAATVILPGKNLGVEINNSECVAKSYPSFYEDLKLIGGRVNE